MCSASFVTTIYAPNQTTFCEPVMAELKLSRCLRKLMLWQWALHSKNISNNALTQANGQIHQQRANGETWTHATYAQGAVAEACEHNSPRQGIESHAPKEEGNQRGDDDKKRATPDAVGNTLRICQHNCKATIRHQPLHTQEKNGCGIFLPHGGKNAILLVSIGCCDAISGYISEGTSANMWGRAAFAVSFRLTCFVRNNHVCHQPRCLFMSHVISTTGSGPNGPKCCKFTASGTWCGKKTCWSRSKQLENCVSLHEAITVNSRF